MKSLTQLLRRKPAIWLLSGFAAIEVLSFGAHTYSIFMLPLFVLLLTVAGIIASKKPVAGIAIQVIELILGSKGYLFVISVAGFAVSFRIALFIVIFAVTLAHMLRDREIRFFTQFAYWKHFALIAAVLLVSILVAFVNGNSFSALFFDANGYLFLAWIFPVTQAIRTREDWEYIFRVGLLATIWVMIKTVFVLLCFSQPGIVGYGLVPLYKWIRNSGVGEITPQAGGFTRIFLQNQIYVLLLSIGLLPLFIQRFEIDRGVKQLLTLSRDWWRLHKSFVALFFLLISALTVVLISFSRSFWFAAAVAIVATSLVLLADQFSWKRFRSLVLAGAFYVVSLMLAYGLMLGIVNLEIPGFPKPNIGDLLGSRLGNLSGEAAAASRWQQLPPLKTPIAEHPVFGSGIGRQVTYISNDPRVREKSPDGTYTTYAFEWGYLDFVLKFGVLGTLFFLAPLFIFLRDLWSNRKLNAHFLPLIGAFVALAATHMFTPYLNHPLGFGCIVLIASILSVGKNQKDWD